MPGHIGTSIVENSRKLVREKNADDPTDSEVELARELYLRAGLPLDNVPDEHIKQVMQQESDDFRDKALTSAEDAASIILEGVKEKALENFGWRRCRILRSGGKSGPRVSL